jgi:hypothetical protein
LSGETLRQADLLSRATVISSCRKNIRLTKQSPNSTLYRMVAARRGILSLFFPLATEFKPRSLYEDGCKMMLNSGFILSKMALCLRLIIPDVARFHIVQFSDIWCACNVYISWRYLHNATLNGTFFVFSSINST